MNRDVFIPGIQRPYVWEPEKIVKLFDSLMRGYPINSFLFWALQPGNFGDWDIYQFVRRFRQGNIHNDAAKPAIDAPDQAIGTRGPRPSFTACTRAT